MTEPAARAAHATLLPEELYLRALAVGRSARGVSGPNPPVGCLVVRDGEVVAEAATGPAGEAHAEVAALSAAGDRACGATAVVTLEPCAHHGRTGPCVDALLSAGVAEVHVLLRDPDPVAAGGLELLARAGVRVLEVAVLRPDLAATAAVDLRGFLSRVRHGRPHVTLKLAQTIEGGTVPAAGGYLTGVAARRHVHALRADSDAVLVGGGTVRADDPRLDVRLVAPQVQPRPVVLSVDAELPSDARVLRPGALVLTRQDATAAGHLRSLGVDVIEVPLADDGSGLDLRAALATLLNERVLTVLAEPGARLASALLDADVVDAIELHVARGGTTATDGIRPALPQLAVLLDDMTLERTVTEDGDLILRTERVVSPSGHAVLGRVA